MRHSDALSAVSDLAQETDAINIGYTVGGMTIGLQSATTENLLRNW